MKKLSGSVLEQSGGALDRLPGLPLILEEFGASAASALKPLFGDAPASQISEIRAMGLFEALKPCEGLTAATLRCDDLDARLMIVLDPDALDIVIASILPNGDANLAAGASARAMTAIDIAMLTEVAKGLGAGLELAFAQAAKARFVFERLSPISDTFGLGRRDMTAVVARAAFRTAVGQIGCFVILPQNFLQSLRQELSIDPPAGPTPSDPRWAKQLEIGVAKAKLTVTAILDQFDSTLGDIARYKPGAVIELSGAGTGRVKLECEGRDIFWTTVRQSDGRYSLEIDSPIEPDAADLRWLAKSTAPADHSH